MWYPCLAVGRWYVPYKMSNWPFEKYKWNAKPVRSSTATVPTRRRPRGISPTDPKLTTLWLAQPRAEYACAIFRIRCQIDDPTSSLEEEMIEVLLSFAIEAYVRIGKPDLLVFKYVCPSNDHAIHHNTWNAWVNRHFAREVMVCPRIITF